MDASKKENQNSNHSNHHNHHLQVKSESGHRNGDHATQSNENIKSAADAVNATAKEDLSSKVDEMDIVDMDSNRFLKSPTSSVDEKFEAITDPRHMKPSPLSQQGDLSAVGTKCSDASVNENDQPASIKGVDAHQHGLRRVLLFHSPEAHKQRQNAESVTDPHHHSYQASQHQQHQNHLYCHQQLYPSLYQQQQHPPPPRHHQTKSCDTQVKVSRPGAHNRHIHHYQTNEKQFKDGDTHYNNHDYQQRHDSTQPTASPHRPYYSPSSGPHHKQRVHNHHYGMYAAPTTNSYNHAHDTQYRNHHEHQPHFGPTPVKPARKNDASVTSPIRNNGLSSDPLPKRVFQGMQASRLAYEQQQNKMTPPSSSASKKRNGSGESDMKLNPDKASTPTSDKTASDSKPMSASPLHNIKIEAQIHDDSSPGITEFHQGFTPPHIAVDNMIDKMERQSGSGSSKHNSDHSKMAAVLPQASPLQRFSYPESTGESSTGEHQNKYLNSGTKSLFDSGTRGMGIGSMTMMTPCSINMTPASSTFLAGFDSVGFEDVSNSFVSPAVAVSRRGNSKR